MAQKLTDKQLRNYFNNMSYLARRDEEETRLMIKTTKKYIDAEKPKDIKS